MKCLHPVTIYNRYVDEYLKVSCRHCDNCLIASANDKALLLRNELGKAWLPLFITLTYDNEHLPIVFYGDNKIYRSPDGRNLEFVDEVDEPLNLLPRKPYKFPFVDCTGVIYYRDFQNFFKRLRINLLRDYGYKKYFRFFIVCEYGSVHKRPHAHIILFFERGTNINDVERAICDSWKMCSETVLRNGFKYADKNASSYLAAYVTCNSRSYSLANNRFFKQRCRRSKNVDYGCSTFDKEEIKRVIRLFGSREVIRDNNRPFEYFDQSKESRFSSCFVSERVFNTYFRKLYRFRNLSFNAFCLRARSIYYFRTRIKGRLSDLPFSFAVDDYFKQADFNFIRGYYAYLDLMGLDDDFLEFEHYLFLFWWMYALYHSQLLRRYMLTYEQKSTSDYFLDAYQSECRFRNKSGYEVYKHEKYWRSKVLEFNVDYFLPYSRQTLQSLNKYRFDYGKRLIPKHLNSMFNLNF